MSVHHHMAGWVDRALLAPDRWWVLIRHGMEMGGRDVPPGWSFDPSTWRRRAPTIGSALVGVFASRSLSVGVVHVVPRPRRSGCW